MTKEAREILDTLKESLEPLRIVVGVCREDNPADVDEAYGEGTYARLFPEEDERP